MKNVKNTNKSKKSQKKLEKKELFQDLRFKITILQKNWKIGSENKSRKNYEKFKNPTPVNVKKVKKK